MTPSKLTAVFGQHHTRIFKVTLFILDFPFLHFSSCTWVRVTVPALNEHVKLNDGGMGQEGGVLGGGFAGWEALNSQSLLSLGQKKREREKAQRGERSLAVLQQPASRRPHLVPAECPEWARSRCLHCDLSTEDHCSPVSTTPFDLSLSSPSHPTSHPFVFWKWLHNSQNRCF